MVASTDEALSKTSVDLKKKKKDKKSSYREGLKPMIKRERGSAEDVEGSPWLDRDAPPLRSLRTCSLVDLSAFPHS